MRRSRLHSLICVWAASTIAVSGCRHPMATTPNAPVPRVAPPMAPVTTGARGARPTVAFDPATTTAGLTVRTPDVPGARGPTAIATALGEPETQALLARLAPLRDLSAQNAAPPSMRAPSLPPPRAGAGAPIAFVVPGGKPVADAPIRPAAARATPLVPPQISPQDAVRSESEIRVRFAEPMVPVSAVGTPATPPATIAPPIAGTWRWIDTRVATFTAAASRFPKATEFRVTVPAGTRALSGATLTAASESTFTTQPVEIAGDFPAAQLRPDSPILVQFDQAIDPTAILPFLRVETAKGTRLAHTPIALAEARRLWERNPSVVFDATQSDTLLGAHHVILAPATAWPAGTAAQVVLAPGAPSREGRRVSVRESFARFEIAPAFTVRGIECDRITRPRMTGATCPASGYLDVVFSNAIAERAYRSSKVQLAGQPFADWQASGASVSLSAPDVSGRHQAIAIDRSLVDVFGQPLVGPHRPTFMTGPERFAPYVTASTGLIVLDPRFAIPQWVVDIQAIAALRVELYAVTPKDYFAYEQLEAGVRGPPPGKRILDTTYTVGPRHGAQLRVDLRPALGAAGLGHVIAIATAAVAPGNPDVKRRQLAWIQVTKLGVTARVDGERVSAWVTDITPSHFLAPIAQASTALIVDGRPPIAPTLSDAEGHVALALLARPSQPRDRAPTALLAVRAGGDSAFAAIKTYERSVRHDDARWYVTDDRFTYKPGEPLYLKGWVRWTHSGVNPELALPRAGESVAYTLTDARGNKLGGGTTTLTSDGGFDATLAIPANANLGTARVSFTTRAATHTHPIEIQEFRAPAYAVSLDDDVSHHGATPVYLGESLEMTASANYYSGGGLGGAQLAWDAVLRPTTYRPPNWNQFSFAPVRARSRYGHDDDSREATLSQPATLTGASTSSIVWGVTGLVGKRPSILTVDATVTDVDRASIRATSRAILIHPSTYYVGVRQAPGAGRLELVVTDVDGTPVRGVPIDVTIEGVLGSEREREDAKLVDTQRCTIASGDAPVTCAWRRLDDKTAYMAVARVTDARGRTNAAQYRIPWWSPADPTQDLAVIPDRAEYRPGDVAKLAIHSKVIPATAIVSFARQGVVIQKRIELTTPATTVELPIEPAYMQNVHVLVDRIARRRYQQGGSAVPLPEHLAVQVSLPVDIESARLAMTVRPLAPLVQPGGQATFEVEVRHDGTPQADAEVALLVVDEAILALSTRSHADPLPAFYRTIAHGTTGLSTLGLVDDSGDSLVGSPGFSRFALDSGSGSGGGGTGWGTIGSGRYGTIGHGSGSGGAAMVESRKDFRATAVFSPRLRTDARGKVRLSVTMPESLTRFRVVAIATANTRNFGKAESTIITQRAINARAIAPRFLSQGDAFALPIVVQNLDATPRTIDVAVRAANLVAVGPSGKRVLVPPGGRAEIRFDFTTKARGRAVIQTIVALQGGDFADASEVELPIYEPATTESFATYGVIDDAPQFEQLAVPADLFADVGGIEVELASTQLQSLTDAYWYLYAYPYECAEQRSGRMIATAAMSDVLEAFATPGRPTHAQIDQQRTIDVGKLSREQRPDGGWGYFGGMTSDPFVTIQVLTALALQKVSGAMTTNATKFVIKEVAGRFARLERAALLPPARRTDRHEHGYMVALAAAALTALAATGVDVRPRAERLHTLATTLAAYPMDARARLLAIVAKLDRAKPMRDTLLAAIVSATHETAAAATVTTTYQEAERLLLVSSTKTSALALDAMMREAPTHPLVTKLARGVLDGRRHGRWVSTQENLVALQTLRRYFDTYEKVTPNFAGKLWFGTAAYAEQAFVGRSSKRGTAQVKWPALPAGSSHDIALVKDGPGRMYYRVGITYAPKRADLPALDAGFLVRRSYTAIDDPADVTKTALGWTIRLGARVHVTLEVINTTKRYGVALVDPLPAGFEAVNERLAIAERAVTTAGDDRWDAINMRDNRSEAFAMSLTEGSHRFSYTVRATTPGTFLAAPAKAEEMYSPETFGRSPGQTVVIQ